MEVPRAANIRGSAARGPAAASRGLEDRPAPGPASPRRVCTPEASRARPASARLASPAHSRAGREAGSRSESREQGRSPESRESGLRPHQPQSCRG